jgi:hypothetical protein
MDDSLFSDQPAPKADDSLFSNEPAPQWSDLPKNIIPDAENVLKGNLDTAGRVAKGVYDLPSDLAETAKQELSGGSPLDTPIAQDVKTVGGAALNAVTGIPKQLANLGSKEQWIQHPAQNAITTGAIVAPMIAPEGAATKSILDAAKTKGANMAADLGEISGNTVKRMRPEMTGAPEEIRTVEGKPNPADVRTQSGARLVKEGVVGGFGEDAGDIWQKAATKESLAGKSVDKALNDIKDWNKSTGEYADVDDPIHVQANPILKTILDIANELRDSARSGIRQASRFWRETYNSLAKKADANNGRLNIDDIRSEMQDVGKDIEGNEKSPRVSAAKDIYGNLADIRDQMINDIAQRAGKPELAKNLLDANEDYSFYSRISKGVTDRAAGGDTGGPGGSFAARQAARGNPLAATGYLGIMSLIKNMRPMLASKLMSDPLFLSKWGPYLEAAAKKGPKNLAMTDYVLNQSNKDYADATK